ncbi:hypothetical protein ACFYW6_28305 [Streptomyces sp. NPDC002659]|uniref:hypothetical protein n=1 Tax=Streptomyces sp. NPDC002659 TaxID=3364656 RepID=UPI003683372A
MAPATTATVETAPLLFLGRRALPINALAVAYGLLMTGSPDRAPTIRSAASAIALARPETERPCVDSPPRPAEHGTNGNLSARKA